MFDRSAELYDLIYSVLKDYPRETSDLAARIRRAHPDARTVLDIACGTAEHARLLAEEHGFEVDGLDVDPTFVRIARSKLSRGTVYEADMTTFSVPCRYDVVLCLFSSIGYVGTLEKVQRTFERFRAHLAEGGIVLVEPWFEPDAFNPGLVFLDTAESPDVKVCRMSHSSTEGRISRIEFGYLIGRQDGIEHVSEQHELGLFTREEILGCFERAGLYAEHESEGLMGRGLYLARVRRPEDGTGGAAS